MEDKEVAPPPSPPPKGRGVIPRYPYWAACMGRGEVFLSRWGVFSLTERTEFTEPFGAQFRAHRTPSASRVHRALLPKIAERMCEIS